jgi:hypothetical protein
MINPAEFLIEPELYLRDGHIIRSIGDAVAYLREHEVRPGVDARDEVLHRREQAPTGKGKQQRRISRLGRRTRPAVGSS